MYKTVQRSRRRAYGHNVREGSRRLRTLARERVRLMQLAVCAVLFAVVFIGKGVFPQRLTQLRLGEGDLEPQAVARLGEVLAPAAGALRRIGGQQQHPGVPGPGHGLHGLFSHRQAAAPQAEAPQG